MKIATADVYGFFNCYGEILNPVIEIELECGMFHIEGASQDRRGTHGV
jgi:hypothetical protein